jgi:ABC-2 type transport system permease protein
VKDLPGTIKAFLIRDATIAVSYRLDFGLKMLSILLYVVVLYYISDLVGESPIFQDYDGGYFAFSVIGLTLLSYSYTGFRAFSSAIRREQMMGTLEAMLMTPARISAIVIASSVWSFFWATITAVSIVATAALLFEIPIQGNIPLAVAVLLLTTLVFACLGVISASFVMSFKRGDPIGFFLGTISLVLGGVFYPVDKLPEEARVLSKFLPITHGLEGLRGIMLQGQGLSEVLPQIMVLLAFAAVGFPLSLFCFQRAVFRAQREGTLVQY